MVGQLPAPRLCHTWCLQWTQPAFCGVSVRAGPRAGQIELLCFLIPLYCLCHCLLSSRNQRHYHGPASFHIRFGHLCSPSHLFTSFKFVLLRKALHNGDHFTGILSHDYDTRWKGLSTYHMFLWSCRLERARSWL
ncbi:hypothetical protein TNCV_5048941 [Trichonephila clavipes]|nr:hypothetical protein TNCV_5048941 [Trichonephila clavipes]